MRLNQKDFYAINTLKTKNYKSFYLEICGSVLGKLQKKSLIAQIRDFLKTNSKKPNYYFKTNPILSI